MHRRSAERARGQGLRFLAAWLGILALTIQMLVPTLLAVELKAAASGDPRFAAAELCAQDVDAAAHGDGSGGGDRPQQPGHPGLPCPICLALHAAVAFIPPSAPVAPAPVLFRDIPGAVPVAALVQSVPAAAYRPRGPPASI